MATTTFDIDIAPILALPTDQKLALSEAIWASIESDLQPPDEELSDELKLELDRRLAAYRADRTRGTPWEEVDAAAAERRKK